MTLKQWIVENGITTFEGLKIRCESIGVDHPLEHEFSSARGNIMVSSPPEGVVVLDPSIELEPKKKKKRIDPAQGHVGPTDA